MNGDGHRHATLPPRTNRKRLMRRWLLIGIFGSLSACAGSGSEAQSDAGDAGTGDAPDAEPDVIVTEQVCKVGADCTMAPGKAYCPEPRTAVRYDEPTCGADQRC